MRDTHLRGTNSISALPDQLMCDVKILRSKYCKVNCKCLSEKKLTIYGWHLPILLDIFKLVSVCIICLLINKFMCRSFYNLIIFTVYIKLFQLIKKWIILNLHKSVQHNIMVLLQHHNKMVNIIHHRTVSNKLLEWFHCYVLVLY